MKQHVICTRCEQRRPPADTDPDFCQDCVDAIEHALATQMERARAAVCYLNGTDHRDEREAVGAFLAIFYPQLSRRRLLALIAPLDIACLPMTGPRINE